MPWSRRRRLLALVLVGSMSAGTAACSTGSAELTAATVAKPPASGPPSELAPSPAPIGESPAPAPAPPTSSPAYSPSSSPATTSAAATSDATTSATATSAAATSDACDQQGALIAQALWITVEGQGSLEVTPTALLRTCARAAPAWVELVEFAPGADTPGMAEQFRCHVLFAPRKDVWHLEPWRPVVDGAEMIRTRCNPGALTPTSPSGSAPGGPPGPSGVPALPVVGARQEGLTQSSRDTPGLDRPSRAGCE